MRQRDTTQQSRFKDAPWFPRHDELCMVGGAGGIGSWLCYFLTKIGFKINLYDFDTVEDHNLGGQLFFQEDVGRNKVQAVSRVIQAFCNAPLSTFNERIDLNTMTHYYVFSAFDNMKARNDLFQVWKKSWIRTPVGVTPSNADRYEKEHLFSDSAVDDAPCTMKQSSHTAAMIGTIMTSYFTNHIANTYAGETIREVPFYYEFVVPMNYSASEL